MIKIFSDPIAAQELCDEIHKYLQENCPNYSASCWQLPNKAEKSELYYVEIPYEYNLKDEPIEKQPYIPKTKIDIVLAVSMVKAVQEVEKLPADWVSAVAVAMEEEKLP